MKAIIPVAGAGTNLRPHTYTQPKALIPMAGRTILSVIVDELIKWNIDEYIFIIGYLGEKIQKYVEDTYPQINASFVTQNTRNGTAEAILLTEDLVKDDQMIIVYGDTICSLDIQKVLESNHSLIGVKRVADPRLFGVAEVDEHMKIIKLTEKPLIPKSNFALVGVFKIIDSASLFEHLKTYIKSGEAIEGEYHFTDGIQLAIDNGMDIKAWEVKSWYDCGKKDSLLDTNATLLKKMQREGYSTENSYRNTVIIPPVHIGANCQLENSIIGPYVSIGDNTKVTSSILSNSIIGSFTFLDEIVLKSSIIGSDAKIKGSNQSLNIGDNTDIDLG